MGPPSRLSSAGSVLHRSLVGESLMLSRSILRSDSRRRGARGTAAAGRPGERPQRIPVGERGPRADEPGLLDAGRLRERLRLIREPRSPQRSATSERSRRALDAAPVERPSPADLRFDSACRLRCPANFYYGGSGPSPSQRAPVASAARGGCCWRARGGGGRVPLLASQRPGHGEESYRASQTPGVTGPTGKKSKAFHVQGGSMPTQREWHESIRPGFQVFAKGATRNSARSGTFAPAVETSCSSTWRTGAITAFRSTPSSTFMTRR